MIKPRAFSHAALKITDVERARNFYEKVLGLTALPRPNFGFGGAWYEVGDNQIHLISLLTADQQAEFLGTWEKRGQGDQPARPAPRDRGRGLRRHQGRVDRERNRIPRSAQRRWPGASSGSSIPTATPSSSAPRSSGEPDRCARADAGGATAPPGVSASSLSLQIPASVRAYAATLTEVVLAIGLQLLRLEAPSACTASTSW